MDPSTFLAIPLPVMDWAPSRAQVGVALSLAAVLAARSILRSRAKKARNPQGLPYPPGLPSKGLPLLGNVFDFPQEKHFKVYAEWAKEYGNLIMLDVFGMNMLIVNSYEDITGLLEKNSVNTANRPPYPLGDLLELPDVNFGGMAYGSDWKAHRKAFHQTLAATHVPKYHPVMEEEVSAALRELVEKPEDFLHWARDLVSNIMMRVAYGVKDTRYNKELIHKAEEYMEIVSDASTQGKYLVNVFPKMKYIPSWFPGAAWKRFAYKGAALGRALSAQPYADALARVRSGQSNEYHSMVDVLIASLPSEGDPEFPVHNRVAKNVSATAYSAGADTTITSLQALFLALAMFPEAQRKAQEEIDRVTDDGSRLPQPSDINELPYLRALVKELGRWHTVAPLAIPHEVMEDETYKGYFIPKGTFILPNTWSVTNDPQHYPNPREFKPERFLTSTLGPDGMTTYKEDPSVLDPGNVVFGYGRRVCPGRHLSKDVLTFAVMNVIALFDIKPPAWGKPLELDATTGLVSKAAPDFKVDVTPRSKRHLSLIP